MSPLPPGSFFPKRRDYYPELTCNFQAMFMRSKSHTCQYCTSIDEAHFKRHKDIAEQLCSIYESCSDSDWTIIPTGPEERGRPTEFDGGSTDSGEVDRSFTPENTLSSKREKKEAKRLARASDRSRVVTHLEIEYVDSVLHAADGVSNSDSDSPRNTEEIEEIERHLRYNAHVYNTQPNLRELKRLAHLPNGDVDFAAEMERILETFRVGELVKRNTRNRGLQGKELKTFHTRVEDFKKAVVEDLVLTKKDVLEIRMRRAGYLRYTNKTAYGIVEDRYTDKDWKTGEKFTSSSSASSGVMSPVEELGVVGSKQQENSSHLLPLSTQEPDRRHLESSHKRVNGDDGLDGPIIEPYSAPLLTLLPDPTPRKKPISLKVVATKTLEAGAEAMNAWGKRKARLEQDDGWQTISHDKKATAVVVKPVWGHKLATHSSGPNRQGVNRGTIVDSDFPELPPSTQNKTEDSGSNALAVQPPAAAKITDDNGPEQFIVPADRPVNDSVSPQPMVPQKKKAKKAREAKRKARKETGQENAMSTTMVPNDIPRQDMDDIDAIPASAFTSAVVDFEDPDFVKDEELPKKSTQRSEEIVSECHIAKAESQEVLGSQSSKEQLRRCRSLSTDILVTKDGKHMHWIKFARHFVADQLTGPFFPSWSGCSHNKPCVFEGNSIPDCPFHEPHCPCVDPLLDKCYLVYPCGELCTSGPYNRLRGEKLLAMYEKDSRTSGRLMLVDDDMVHYLMQDPSCRAHNGEPIAMPERLAVEYTDFADGHNPGPLMEQERQFERLWQKNKAIKQHISRKMLQDIQRRTFERPGTEYICYCQAAVPEENHDSIDIIPCSYRDCERVLFHKSCVKNLGVDKVSRWYCTSCEKEMQALARVTLRALGFKDIPYEADVDGEFEQKQMKKVLGISNTNMREIYEYARKHGGKLKLQGVGVKGSGVNGTGTGNVKANAS
ncbi:Nn.00g113590.m01.CDS01 [Neocucurbitaria sp. VM-36]